MTAKKSIPQKTQTSGLFPVVGIGASAGGLEAFSELLKNLPANTGMAYIFVSHLEPTHKSLLAEILSQITTMPLIEAKDGLKIEPNHVYIIPPNTSMTISKGILKLVTRTKISGLHLPIDHFLSSLAKDGDNRAIGIILSGAASDGSRGIKAIKEVGGITFAQDEKSAKYSSMPHYAIATGSVDFILTPSEIAKELIKISKLFVSQRSAHLYPNNRQDRQTHHWTPSGENGLREIFHLLHSRNGLDFSQYKQTTIKRRIERRIVLNKIESLKKYVKFLGENPAELEALYQDMLIAVTHFFRDPEKFKSLKTVVFPNLTRHRSPRIPIRIWVPGCSTGEEAYSIVICLLEYLGSQAGRIPVQIFATDVNGNSIEKARLGFYPPSIATNVSPQRLERFFVKTEGHYQVIKPIRDMCIFALHNLIQDPPFSRLDLISCSNVLIYMEPPLQQKIMSMFHYALNPTGFLLLGNSETVGVSSELFSLTDKKSKTFSKKATATKPRLDFSYALSQQKIGGTQTTNSIKNTTTSSKQDTQSEVDRILLSKYTPAGIVVSDTMEIIEFRGPTSRYLEHPSGQASLNLLKMAPESLLLELRSLIHKAQKEEKTTRKEQVSVRVGEQLRTFTLEVVPLMPFAKPYFLVLFEEKIAQPEKALVGVSTTIQDRETQRLHQELSDTRKYLQSMIKDQDVTNEELKAANEEILSSNEELQSINEELETSKEEIQSTNEELITVNEELQNRNDQLRQARDYTQAIVGTVREPLVILNSSFRVQSANSSFYKTFQVTQEETEGNLLYELGDGQWNIPKLRTLLEGILPKSTQFEDFEVEHTFANIGHRIMRLNARQVNHLKMILLAIEDITEKKAIERHRQIEQQKDEFIAQASHELKTPITTIKGYTDILTKQFEKANQHKYLPYVSKMNFQINRLTALINELLDVSKIQAGKLSLHKEDIDIDKFIKDIATDMQQTSEKHHLTFEGNVKNKMINVDKYRLSQVIVNLIANAIKYSPKSDKVIIKTKLFKKQIIISVQDFGIGISEKDQARVFDRFFQARTHIRESSFGLGLGLYISSEIVKRHRGKIWVDSIKGKGSTFYFKLPIKGNKHHG